MQNSLCSGNYKMSAGLDNVSKFSGRHKSGVQVYHINLTSS